MSRWGIIYCPKRGERHSQKHWERVRDYLAEREVEYDFVQSESADSVGRLAAMLATNGYRRIVIVGGDSALNRALNGILSLPDTAIRQEMELAVIPHGFINDFAHYWGFMEDDYKRAIDWIVGGRVRTVDIGFIEPAPDAEGEQPARRYFLNCVNIGLASDLISIHRTSQKWGVLRYANRSLRILFRRKERHITMHVNRDCVDRKVMNVCIGSCHGYGQTPNAVPYNGLLDVSVINHPDLRHLGQGIWLLASGRFMNFKNVEVHRTRSRIVVDNAGGAPVSIDGLLCPDYAGRPLSVGILPEHIKFVIPPISF